MTDDGQFGQAIHSLLKELGWTHGELTASLVHQALAQVRHLRKQADSLASTRQQLADLRDIESRTVDVLSAAKVPPTDGDDNGLHVDQRVRWLVQQLAAMTAARDEAIEACRDTVKRANEIHARTHENKLLLGHGIHDFLHYCIGASRDGETSGPRAALSKVQEHRVAAIKQEDEREENQ